MRTGRGPHRLRGDPVLGVPVLCAGASHRLAGPHGNPLCRGDHLVSRQSVEQFAAEHGAGLTVLEGGEHWFHTEEQMALLDSWVKKHLL